jgi:uncharacterized tellurite resistance protein B-like protein
MLTKMDAIALLKVLVAAAWADSKLTQSELNYIKILAQKFRLTDEDWLELQPYIEDPPTEKEVNDLFEDLLNRISTGSARNKVVQYLEEMMQADDQVTAEEHDFLEHYTLVLKQASTGELLLRRMKALFSKRNPEAVIDLDEFVHNKVLFKLRRRIGTDRITPETRRLCVLGGLMGIVAQADGEIDARELEEIRTQLRMRNNFDLESLEILMTIIEEESVRGLERASLVAEYAANATYEDRVELLDLLFAVAAADRALTYTELEELRGISAALGLSHRQYIDAKLRARAKSGKIRSSQ